MLARLLYAAVGLCLLGTVPERGTTRIAPPVEEGARAPAPAAITGARPADAGIAGAPADFAIPRIQR